MDWRHRAACLTEDPELFFPVGNTGPAIMQIAEARCEPVAKQMAEREDMIGGAAGIGIVLMQRKVAGAQDKPVEHVRRFTCRRGHDP